ncbi:uncharacterized protein LOC129759605 [Uranotaenia lowii]|uniref:uncharacterized protein LOC129759605 n=1 Tax=Uranotaenia lowii TaxID=190385 RepID=UPI00247963C8|nr:uncharacterized protein LOC129759605 [Uranotaenia lowii]
MSCVAIGCDDNHTSSCLGDAAPAAEQQQLQQQHPALPCGASPSVQHQPHLRLLGKFCSSSRTTTTPAAEVNYEADSGTMHRTKNPVPNRAKFSFPFCPVVVAVGVQKSIGF